MFIYRKLRSVLTTRILRFLQDQAKKQPEEYLDFYREYNSFFKEGIITSNDNSERVIFIRIEDQIHLY